MRMLEVLDQRTLLAFSQTFLDTDGDEVTVKLSGNGGAALTLSNGAEGFIEFIQLTGTDAKSALTITVKQAGGDGTVRLDGISSASLGRFTGKGADILGDAEFSDITSFTAGDIGDVDLDLDPPVGKTLSIRTGHLGGSSDIQVDGNVKQITIASSASDARVRVFGVVSAIKCVGNMGGEWLADSFGNVTVGEFFTGQLIAFTPNDKGYSFGAFRAQAVKGGSIVHEMVLEFGRIRSITTDLWASGQIQARGVDTIKVKGDFAPDDVTLTENREDAFSIKAMTIGGIADAPFQLGAPVGTIKIFACGGDLEFHDNSGLVHVKSLSITGPDGARGSYAFTSIGTLKVTAVMAGEWTLGGGDALGRSVKSLKAGRIDQCQFASSGGIVSMTVGRVFDSIISTFFIGALSVKPGAFGDGTFSAVNLLVTGDNLGQSIKAFSVKGECGGSDIRTISTIGSFSALRLNGLAMNIGDVSQSAFDAFNVPVTADTVINSFTLTGAFDVNQPVFSDSRIVGGRFAKIVIKGFASPDATLALHGFAAATFTSVTMKDLNGATIKPVIGDALADINPFAPAGSDFIFRVAFV